MPVGCTQNYNFCDTSVFMASGVVCSYCYYEIVQTVLFIRLYKYRLEQPYRIAYSSQLRNFLDRV